MKKLRFFIITLFAIGCLFALVGCAAPLSRPRDLIVNSDTLDLSWRAVPNVRYYTVQINGDERETRQTKYSLASLEEGEYEIRVKACSNGSDFRDSSWSETYRFTRESECGLVFTLINSRTEYEVTGMGSAEGEVVVPAEYRGKPVTSIGNRAFANRTYLTGITLPETIVNIGAQAFYQCSFLTHINLPANLKSIGEQAFQDCRALAIDLTIPDGITEIPASAFSSCRTLKSVTMGDRIKTIGDNAFFNCVALKNIVIPNGVESLGEYAFAGCSAVQYISFGSSLKSIGERAFVLCSNVSDLTLGGAIETVGPYAFNGCVSLATLTVGDNVKTLGEGAFSDCTRLGERPEDLSLGDGLTSIGRYCFLRTAIWNDEESMVYVDDWFIEPKEKTLQRLPAMKEGTRGIADFAFYGCNSFETYTLPNSVEIIGANAFRGCKEMTIFVTGSGVKVIGANAFNGCIKLITLRLCAYENNREGESSLEELQDGAFYGCSRLSAVRLPDTVKKIGSRVFRNSGLYMATGDIVYAGNWIVDSKTSAGGTVTVRDGTVGVATYAFQDSMVSEVIFPDTVETIGRGAFSGCGMLRGVTLPSALERIEDYTFYNCNLLMIDTVPDTVTYIGRSAFYNCHYLGMKDYINGAIEDYEGASFTIPDSVETIGPYAFYGCGQLVENQQTQETALVGFRTLTIGNGVTSIGERAFARNASLKTVNIGSGVREIPERAFYRCENLETVNFGSVRTIGNRAFYGCIALKNVLLPASATTVEEYAFYNCENLSTLSLGGVKRIGNFAFAGCKTLGSITDYTSLDSIGKQAFRGALVTSFILTNELTELDVHVFYKCGITFYIEGEKDLEGWSARWNSTYCPAVYGVTLSADKTYVVSFVKSAANILNVNELAQLSAPLREGYAFLGWATEEGGSVVYSASEAVDAEDGTTLYAVWQQN